MSFNAPNEEERRRQRNRAPHPGQAAPFSVSLGGRGNSVEQGLGSAAVGGKGNQAQKVTGQGDARQHQANTDAAAKDNTARNAGIAASAFIPVIGPVVAATGAAVAANQDKKAAERGENRPERRRFTRAQELRDEGRSRSQRALATLSQAVFQYASSIR